MLREKPHVKDARGTLKRLWYYLQRQKWALVAAALLITITAALELLGPYLMGRAIDDYITKRDLLC
jgi:ATP-binding cassette subfamily B protein